MPAANFALCERRSVEQSAKLRGADNEQNRRWFGILLRKCLAVLAVEFGFASSTKRPPRPARLNGDGGIPDPDAAYMRANAVDLVDPRFRSGRPKGANHGGNGA
jgi:hypothetical protein